MGLGVRLLLNFEIDDFSRSYGNRKAIGHAQCAVT